MFPLLLSGLLILWLLRHFVKTRLKSEGGVKVQAEAKIHGAEDDVQSRPQTGGPTPELAPARSGCPMQTQPGATSIEQGGMLPRAPEAEAEAETHSAEVVGPLRPAPEAAAAPPAQPARGSGFGGTTRPNSRRGSQVRERLKFILGASEDNSSDEEPEDQEEAKEPEWPDRQAMGVASSSRAETPATSAPSCETRSGMSTSCSPSSIR